MEACDAFYFFGCAQENGYALMNLDRFYVENAFMAVGCCAARIFHDHRHGIGFVQKTKLAWAVGGAGIARIHENAAALQDAVHFGNHGGNPAHVEVFPANSVLALEQLGNVALNRLFPEPFVRHVDGEFFCFTSDANVFAC